MEKVKLDNRRILFNLLPAHVAQHFLLSNPRNMVSLANRQADKQVDKQTESMNQKTPKYVFDTITLYSFIRISTISPTHKSASCLHRSPTSTISTSSWMATTWESSA